MTQEPDKSTKSCTTCFYTKDLECSSSACGKDKIFWRIGATSPDFDKHLDKVWGDCHEYIKSI